MFLAHSVILSARSDFFKAAFSSVPLAAAVREWWHGEGFFWATNQGELWWFYGDFMVIYGDGDLMVDYMVNQGYIDSILLIRRVKEWSIGWLQTAKNEQLWNIILRNYFWLNRTWTGWFQWWGTESGMYMKNGWDTQGYPPAIKHGNGESTIYR